jgi:hypothetical protein
MSFVTYITATVTPQTLEDLLASLTGPQKLDILQGYADGVSPDTLKHTIPILVSGIKALYTEIDAIRDECRILMREEKVEQEAVYDTDGITIITPAVYNTAPADVAELKATVSASFADIFSTVEVGAVIDKMILYTEKNLAGEYIGTWAVYAAEVVK